MIDQTFSHYRILEELGSGGMGVVYKAEDTRLSRPVAIKFLPDTFLRQPDALERFRREARMASALNHPNICTIYDIDEHNGQPFIVMELLEGEPLNRMLNDVPLNPDVVVELGIQIADALDAAHARRIVHRDIKPANIFVTHRRQAKLLDFGLAKAAPDSSSPEATTMRDAWRRGADPLTSPGLTMGTIAYMSPEQARGEPLDARTDLFSFGAVLYEMLTGRRAFAGSGTAMIFAALLRETPPSVSRVNPGAPAELARIVDKALEKDRNLRYQSAADLRADLRRMHRTDSGRTASAASPTRTIAVVPFRDLADDASSEVWGIGITDAIIGRLASVRHLAVRPTTAVLKYIKSPADAAQIARELEVESVLTGTFLRIGDLIRVSVQLVGGQPQTTRWACRYDLRADDLLRFQDEVAQQVVDGLSIPLSSAEQESLALPLTGSADAHDLYVRARFHWMEFSVRSERHCLEQGQRLLEQAIALDPNFAHAHALLSFLNFYESANFSDKAPENLQRARASAQRALAIDPNLPDGWIALGAMYSQTGQNEDAIRTLRRGVELAPNSDLAWDLLGYAYHYAGLVELAESSYRRARVLNPTSRRLYWLHARMLLYVDRTAEAIDVMRFAWSMDHAKALAHLGKFLYYAGQMEEAERVLARALELNGDQKDPAILLLAAYLPASRGQRDRITPWVLARQPAESFDGDDAYWTGGVYALLGEKDPALAWLRRAVARGNHNYPFFHRDRNYRALRGDPDYEAILGEVRRHWERYKQLFGRT
jgi:serine/threonine protein kinase/Tfp pilus assembly protein PilF